MPTRAEARPDALARDISAAVSAIRCALTLLDATALNGAERALLQAVDNELGHLARAVSGTSNANEPGAYLQ
jgi:hypothetical protein